MGEEVVWAVALLAVSATTAITPPASQTGRRQNRHVIITVSSQLELQSDPRYFDVQVTHLA
jgi:hypothetical protein